MAKNELNNLIDWATANGWKMKRCKNSHFQFRHKNAAFPVHVSSTFSDHRGPLNAKADMRRAITIGSKQNEQRTTS